MDSHETKFPPTLHPRPAATLYLDGLIFLVHNRETRLSQAAIHTRAAHHSVRVKVTRTNDNKVIFSNEHGQHFDGSHRHVKAVEPLQLFVDSGGGWNPHEFSTSLYKENDDSDPQSYKKVLDFERALYTRPLTFNRDVFAVLNVAQGEFYSALVQNFNLMSFPQGDPDHVSFVKRINSCSLVGADIESGGAGRHLVLKQSKPGQEVFRIELKEGEHYAVEILNIPSQGGGHGQEEHSIKEHFLRYYDLFKLRPGEPVFFVEEIKTKFTPFGGVDSPPCNTGGGGTSSGFPPP